MSIFINGMKMPTNCQQCPCAYWVSQFEFLGCNVKPGKRYAMMDEEYRNSSTRPEWCPLVEVPTPHGKIVDIDAVLDGINNVDHGLTCGELIKQTTIIEAEE